MEQKQNTYKLVGDILIALSVLSLPIAIILSIMTCGTLFEGAAASFFWICLLFLPIPFASLIFGFVLFYKTHKQSNIWISSGFAVLLLAGGVVGLTNKTDKSDFYLRKVEQSTGIVFPSATKQMTDIPVGSDWIVDNILILDEAEEQLFQHEIRGDKWTDTLPSFCKGMFPPVATNYDLIFKYHCFFVEPGNIFNPTFLSPGKYSVSYVGFAGIGSENTKRVS